MEIKPEDNIAILEKVVNELYDFKSRYFIGKEAETLTETRDEAVKKKLEVWFAKSSD